jgi:outer membrane protein insertion porin family
MKRIAIAILLASQLLSVAHGFDAFVVSDIRVEGLQRISPGTVFNYLPVKVGDTLDESGSKEAIRALFKTGFFKDVRLRQEGTVLVVDVDERPSIASIELSGNKEFDDDTLKEAMKRVGFAEGRVFDPSVLDRVEQELKGQYFALGKYAAAVKTTVTPLERNRVGINLSISEGETAKIKQINIVGNKVFTDKELLKQFSLSTKSAWNILSKRDRYSKQKLSGDLEALRSFYQDQGYLDFDIASTQVSITPDKRDIYITVNISEGEQYTVSEYKLAGKLILPQDELLALISFKPGDVFSRKEVTKSSKSIADRLADDGYAFANVNAAPEIDKEKRTVSFTFFVDPGRRVYVRRINISGNTTTRDEVIRREMRQLEGGWFSAEAVRRSRVRLQRLGFFDDVNIETPAVPGSPDQVDVNVVVKERATGSLLFGLGYSDADGVLLQASISQRNLFGTGKELHINVDNSAVSDVVNIRYVDPYYTPDGISRGFNIFSQRIDAQEADTAEYVTDTLGAGISFKIPTTEYNSVNLGLGYEKIDLESTSETPPEILAFINDSPSNNILKGTVNWAHDTRDSFLFPTSGWLHRIALEAALPGGDLEYYKLRYETNYYHPVGRSLVVKLGGELGYGDGYGDTQELPFFKNFYAGGAYSVRGYKARSLGPRDSGDTPEPLGGNKLFLANAEVLFPVPGASDSKDKRLSVFVDAGQVYGPDEDLDLGEVRYSAGVAFNWFSPLGPLSISLAAPLNDSATDDTETVQFTLGRIFQ